MSSLRAFLDSLDPGPMTAREKGALALSCALLIALAAYLVVMAAS